MNVETNKTDGLSDEQFCELLMGRASTPDAKATALQDAVASYRTETLLWAERRSAAMPSLVPTARRAGIWAAVPQWSLAAVALLSVAIGAVHFSTASQETAAVDAPVSIARAVDTVATPKEIADDNVLLHSIDAAVNAGSGLPVDALGLDSGHGAGRARGSMD